MKPGDHVIWLYSPGRSFLAGCKLQEVPGVVERVCRHRIRIRVRVDGREKIVNVDPENVISGEEMRYLVFTGAEDQAQEQTRDVRS